MLNAISALATKLVPIFLAAVQDGGNNNAITVTFSAINLKTDLKLPGPEQNNVDKSDVVTLLMTIGNEILREVGANRKQMTREELKAATADGLCTFLLPTSPSFILSFFNTVYFLYYIAGKVQKKAKKLETGMSLLSSSTSRGNDIGAADDSDDDDDEDKDDDDDDDELFDKMEIGIDGKKKKRKRAPRGGSNVGQIQGSLTAYDGDFEDVGFEEQRADEDVEDDEKDDEDDEYEVLLYTFVHPTLFIVSISLFPKRNRMATTTILWWFLPLSSLPLLMLSLSLFPRNLPLQPKQNPLLSRW